MLSAIVALALAPTGGAPATETVYYVLAEDNLSDAGKRLNNTKFDDKALGNLFIGAETGNTAVLLRVEKEDGKVKEISVSVARRRQPKAAPYRDKPFTKDDKDFPHLLKAIDLRE